MKTVLALIALVGLISVPLMAQDYPKAEVFGGYQYLHLGGISSGGVTSDGQSFNGWNASLTGNFSKHFGVAGDFGGGYATISGVSTHVYTYTGGPVVSLDSGGKINPFVHALFGGVHASASASSGGVTGSVSKNGFTMLFGGGVDAKINKAIAIRLIQADVLYYHFSGIAGGNSISQSNNVRISTGIVFNF